MESKLQTGRRAEEQKEIGRDQKNQVCRDYIAAALRLYSETYPDSQQPASPQVIQLAGYRLLAGHVSRILQDCRPFEMPYVGYGLEAKFISEYPRPEVKVQSRSIEHPVFLEANFTLPSR
ncbi:hypothetical protein EVAR_54124_1 [Eumeta japonica]|uniref:Uncharacterized protein n=1 Tax=Eumeta variegata TaxID=151549 RepID=A0A4C1Z168_EUMVA|nr:hypothetical protein EVAR_54124_1 [Eumeta japonica]